MKLPPLPYPALVMTLTLLLSSCGKSERMARVTMSFACASCTIELKVDGAVKEVPALPTTSPANVTRYQWSEIVDVGTSVSATARATGISNRAVTIQSTVDKWNLDTEYFVPTDSAALGRTVRMDFEVPDLDRFGQVR
ncbi:MAG TPA: hypothetical protein VGE21_00960 [Flavobacteriales bacterium]